MPTLKRAWWRVELQRRLLNSTGTECEKLFSDIMRRRFPGDFVDPKPWGSQGDWKCDGLLPSQGKLFAVYCPEKLEEAPALKKIGEDFEGAMSYWADKFDTWVFVCNAPNAWQGLPPAVVSLIADLRQQNPSLEFEMWGPPDILREATQLPDDDLVALLGPAYDLVEFGAAEIKDVLEGIAAQESPRSQAPAPVSQDKLYRNDLSADVQQLLQNGMVGQAKVRGYFESHPDPTYENRICAAFTKRYNELRDQDLDGDLLFTMMRDFAGTEARLTLKHDAAVFALLAYLFERCDIFEDAD